MDASKLALVVALGLVAAGCGGSPSSDMQLTDEIAATRAACTPFGDSPRPVQPLADALFAATCLGDGGKNLKGWSDPDGTPRQACLYEPASASTTHKLPLVIYFHPSLLGDDLALDLSNIRSQTDTADLTGDPARPGFILLAPYGRVTARYYPLPDNALSPGWDNWYRQLQPGSDSRSVNGQRWPENVDAVSVDHFLQQVLDGGKVDERRIYVMGWSNGSAMGVLYSLNRPQIAAAAVYSAPDPFAAFDDPCPQTPVARTPADDTELQLLNSDVPIYQVHNACDIAGLCPNSERLMDSLAALGTPTEDRIIDNLKQSTDACEAICGTDPNAVPAGLVDPLGYLEDLPGYTVGTLNHLTWPYGWTDEMFGFLREHARN